MHLQRVAVVTSMWLTAAILGAVPAGAGGRADHLMCYRMTDKLAVTAAVDMIADLQPQFSQRGCTLVKPIEFCVPASKQNVQPPPAATELSGQPLRQDYVCYLAKCNKRAAAPASQLVADQFGVRPEVNFKAAKICVPASKFPARCGAATSPTCGGACPPGEECKANAAGAGCSCLPAPCAGAPDKAGMCGGTCPQDQICRLATNAAGKTACTCQQVPPPPCGKNPLSGSCGGDCTDPTLKCLPDVDGACICQQPPPPAQFCGIVPGAVCGGECPNPDDTCVASTVDPNKPCVCAPAPCRQDPLTGACAGGCDPAAAAGTCHLDSGTHQCTCGPPPCGVDPATGQCGGPCPSGGLCAANAANQCVCTSPCGFDQQQVCGGGCPPGETCAQQGQECLCTAPPPCGFGAEVAGFCSGSCPVGTSCHTTNVSKSTLACVCLAD